MRVDFLTCDACGAKLGQEHEYVRWRHVPANVSNSVENFVGQSLEFCNMGCINTYFSKLLKERNQTHDQ
jgi:hypothetical protein